MQIYMKTLIHATDPGSVLSATALNMQAQPKTPKITSLFSCLGSI